MTDNRSAAWPVERLCPGPDGAEVIALVHGFTQNQRCWSPFADELGRFRSVVAVDLPGHGRSAAPSGTLATTGTDIVQAVSADVRLGYSLGGRLLLHGLLGAPGRSEPVILIGAHPGIEDAAERAQRLAEDLAQADAIESGGLVEFLDRWLRLPLFERLTPEQAHLEDRLTNDPGAVAAALRAFSTGRQRPLWNDLHQLHMPVLVVAGALDRRYCDIGERTAAAIGPNATFVTVPDAGHAAHLEAPVDTARIVESWLAALRR